MEELEIKIEDLSSAPTRQVAESIVKVLDIKKGRDIKLIHVEEYTSIAEYYVLCTGLSRTQVQSLTDELSFRMGQMGVPSYRKEAGETGMWNLLDFGPILVHIFSREGREFYHLEKLYKDKDQIDISSLLIEN